MDQRVQPDGRDAQLGQEIQCGRDGLNIGPQHGGIGHHIQRAGQGIFQAFDRLQECAVRPHHQVMDFRLARFERDLDMVQTGCHQLLYVSWV